MREQHDPARAAWSAHASPPLQSSSDRLATALHEWETRNLSPWRRGLAGGWRRSRRAVGVILLGGVLLVLGVGFTAEPGRTEGAPDTLAERLRRAEDELKAREGELALARLEIRRLHAIVEQAQAHSIPADLATSIYDIAVSEGVDPALAFSLVRVESGFTRRAVSSAGAVGLTQVMPSTAFWLQPGLSYGDLFEPSTNLRLGFRYLRLMMKQYEGDLHLALLAYNRGPGRVDDILRAGGNPANGYSTLVRNGVARSGLD